MNTVQRFSVPAVLALASVSALAASQVVDSVASPALIRCNTTAAGAPVNAVHADKIIFHLTGPLQAVNPAAQQAVDAIPRDSKLDIKVLDNPATIAVLKGKVLSFIGVVDNANSRAGVTIDEVAYAMVCPVKPFALPAAEF
jgi:hypothetical protein